MDVQKERKLKKLEDEQWKDVPGTEGKYQVSNYGRVKSFAYNKGEGKVLRCSIINNFTYVQLNLKDERRRCYVHKLVAEVWLGQPSEKHEHVLHLDGNLRNNQVENLKWATKDMVYDAFREKRKNSPRKIITHSKLKESDVAVLKGMLLRGVSQVIIAKMFSISEMQVTRIKRGENWAHVKAVETE